MLRSLLTIATLVSFLSAFADDTFQYILGIHGYDPAKVTDLSASTMIRLPEPYLAYVNITGISDMPTTKTQNLHAWLEFYDGAGNFFRKRVTLNVQGNSSLGFVKRNISVNFYEEKWDGGNTPDITFGNWVKQDAFHLKAYYGDFFRGCGKIAYDIYDDITSDRECPLPWQRAKVATASANAMCHPNGFPCYIYLNDRFYGLYVWSLKKNHKNMGQEKDNPLHIHIDGTISDKAVFDGSIDWSQFEVRTPKGLYCVDVETPTAGGKPRYKMYDGNHPSELIDETMPYFDPTNQGHVLTNKVKQSLVNLSNYYARLQKADETHPDAEAFRALYSQFFDTQGLIDYFVHTLVTNNYDGHWKNWQWFTYDGVKWFVEPYDLDCTFGLHHTGGFIFPPEWYSHTNRYYQIPANACQKLFLKYFPNEVRERYIELREKRLINAQRYISYFQAWEERIGTLGYEMEFARWPESPC
ncbi:MAG: CotH kinase family protein, partial [Bacteroidaceae bacterium]|nr:CotH kinase family protein [Bacteroidaceae bacterium]